MLRVVNLERLKKLYAQFSIPQLLTEYSIGDNELVPIPVDSNVIITNKEHFTPLWYYDNVEFDSRNPDEWLKKDNNGINLPVPAIVYLPTNSNEESSKKYNWMDANIIDYNSTLKKYLVVMLDNNSTKVYNGIPRIQIHFKGEDPREFVKRIKYAILRREYCEDMYKWSMYLNKVRVDKHSKYISDVIPDETIKKILRLIFNCQHINKMNKDKNIIVQQINNIYQESCLSSRLKLLISMTKDHHNTLKVPNFRFEQFIRKPATRLTMSTNKAFINSKKEFNRNSLLHLPEVFTALCDSNVENIFIKDTRLLFTVFPIAVTLKEFETIQLKNIFETFNLLKNYWIKQITFKCYSALKNMKNCWFDISISKMKLYESSIHKLRKLMELLKYMMEERLRMVVINSAKGYATLIEQPCIPMKGINDDFVWDSDLNKSPFEDCTPPLFSVILNMNKNGAYYSTDPDTFETVIVSLFKRVILESHELPAIHPYLLVNMKFAEKPYLTSIGLIEPKITELQSNIENNIRLAIIPLKAYCKEFNIFLSLFNMDVDLYVKTFFDSNPSLSRIQEEISMQIKMKLKLEKTFPETITIGLFFISITSLKHSLVKKRIDLADLIMKTHASLTTEKIEICCEEYKRMYLKLTEIPTSIEQVFEIREWIDTLPILISNQSEIVRRLFKDMEMLDTFLWIVDDEQLKLKYDSQIWPYKIELRIKETLENITTNIEKFEKIQFEDELLLQDNVEYLSSIILKLTIENNLSKVNEIAVEVNKNWKLIKDLQLTSQTLNLRQQLFGHTVTPFENVDHLVDEFEPYKILWLSASEFFQLQNAWLQNPLTNIEKSTLQPLLNNLLNIVTKSVELFAEIPGTLSVANEIKTQIEEYKPMIHLLENILTQGMKQRHWDIFFDKTGIKVILSPTLTFKKCLALGVQNYIEEIKEISDNASKEYTIEIALNKMMDEWNGVKLKLLPYNDKDMYISTISDKELQMLDDHMLITQRLSLCSFKGVFEEPLTQWEHDLRLSKDVIKEWSEFQKKWMYLKPIFDDPNIKDQLPVENKKFNLVERILSRIMKLTMNKPWVMKTCPDKRLLDQLINGNVQLNKVENALKLSSVVK
ncbi:dynein heavy chain 1, axonemal [Acyrthosiphon pisum]|uniref:Dynein heavy chain linker domain-containing protein n=1 Tax=Acyrthosiphon pisum TaxID=7029 RepID=A0A8R2JV82_ACYPI|nr:dynein heavy chain 1, axonemal [Acyrthosiphon pisum]|eukprot:XP_001944226.2 PREDICTED: dynein heavy chain 1, axonemal [Acyrthosiphon pisum]